MKARTLLLIGACVLLPAEGFSQALTSLQSLRVRYNTRKATVKPEGALKTAIDEVDQQLAEASRGGRSGEMRRLLAKGTTLLRGGEWTDTLDYTNSLVLRTEHVVADSSRPVLVRLEQIYTPSIALAGSVTAHARLHQPAGAATAEQTARGELPPPGALVRNLGELTGVARDLRESPRLFELDARGVADGTYLLVVDVTDGARAIGSARLSMYLRKGLDDTLAKLDAAAASAPQAIKGDILFPVDRVKHVNEGALELRTFSPERDLANAQAVAAAAKSGGNPFAKKTGSFKRYYMLDAAHEVMPYHMYVPATFDPATSYPLVVALHGLGGTEDSFFDGYDKLFPELAEKHGYIVAAPLGYRVDGGYGWGVGQPPADPVTRRSQDLSEQDVMRVLQIVRDQYKIDPSRIYLTGHSLGAIGTWKIAPKYPDVWAAIGTFSGSGAPDTLARITHVPEFVVHGDNDPTVNVRGSRAMVAKARELGIEITYIEVPGGNHGSVVAPNLPGLFDFFDRHRKSDRPASVSQR
jgi:poly(3-hydroxybutyrate) depolymerase